MRRLTAVLGLVLSFACLSRAAEPRVMIVSIDGLRPDLAMRANMPNLRSLMNEGAFSLWCYTTPAAITLPSHTSMLTGVTIERHGIRSNDEKSMLNETLLVPSIFELAKKQGISTGMAAGKAKFALFSPNVDHGWVKAAGSKDVADHAVEIIREHKPRLMFVHMPNVDGVGHRIGWGTREQIEAINDTDTHLGRVLNALREANLYDETVIILSADHGGSGRNHGKDDDRSRFIPWIIRGPGVLKNIDLTQFRELKIQTYDTFATACDVLNIPLPEGIDGKPIKQAFESTDLMGGGAVPTTQPATKPAS